LIPSFDSTIVNRSSFAYYRCPRCKSGRLKSLGRSPNYLSIELPIDFLVSRSGCKNCGLVFLNPQPSASSLASLYDQWHLSYDNSRSSLPDHLRSRTNEFKSSHLKLINKHQVCSTSLLDIGCGNGDFLEVTATCHNWKLTGVDISKEAIAVAKNKIPSADLFCGQIIDISNSLGSYDIITMNDYLEHSQDPFAELDLIAQSLLNKGGIVFLRVPNQGGILSLIIRRYWYAIIPFHLWYFTPSFLTEELESRGLEIIYCSAPGYINYFTYLAGMLKYAFAKSISVTLKACYSRNCKMITVPSSTESGNTGRIYPRLYKTMISCLKFIVGVLLTQIEFIAGLFGKGSDLTIIARRS
jgi:SAM-dependent methyltransferase